MPLQGKGPGDNASEEPAGRAGTASVLASDLWLKGFVFCFFNRAIEDLSTRREVEQDLWPHPLRGHGGQDGLTGVSGQLGVTAGLYDLVVGRDV